MEEELKAIKQALSFLLDQENIRQQELNALNEKIDALSGNFNERDKAFSDWVDDREFKDFDSAYGEKLKPYSETMRKIRQDDYDLARDVYNTYRDSDKGLSPEEFIDSTISALDKYLEDISGKIEDIYIEFSKLCNLYAQRKRAEEMRKGEVDE